MSHKIGKKARKILKMAPREFSDASLVVYVNPAKATSMLPARHIKGTNRRAYLDLKVALK